MTTSYDPAALKAELTLDEGVRTVMYKDTEGFWTVGIGHNCSIPQSVFTVNALYQNDVNGCEASLDLRFPWWRKLDPVRQLVMVALVFNLGGASLETFTTFISLMKAGDYDAAANDLKTTLWARQVGERASRMETLLKTGEIPS